MPTYDFQCLKCERVYDAFSNKYDESGKYPDIKCPECGSKRKKKQVNTFAFTFANPVGTDRYEGSHDYRAKHKMPKAIAEREAASKKATDATGYVGKKPYKDYDDLNKNNFGEVK